MHQTKKSKNIFAKVSEDKKDTKKGSAYKPSELEKTSAKVAKQFKQLQKWDGSGTPSPSIIPSAISTGVQAQWVEELDADGKVVKGWAIQQKDGNKWKNVALIKDPKDFKKLGFELGYDFAEKGISQDETVIFMDNVQPRTYDQYLVQQSKN